MSEYTSKIRIYIEGFITGGVIGGLAVLLFTPKRFISLKKYINERSDELLIGSNQINENEIDNASKIINDAIKKAEKITNECRNEIESLIKVAGEGYSNSKEAVKAESESCVEERNMNKDNSSISKNNYNEDRYRSRNSIF